MNKDALEEIVRNLTEIESILNTKVINRTDNLLEIERILLEEETFPKLAVSNVPEIQERSVEILSKLDFLNTWLANVNSQSTISTEDVQNLWYLTLDVIESLKDLRAVILSLMRDDRGSDGILDYEEAEQFSEALSNEIKIIESLLGGTEHE